MDRFKQTIAKLENDVAELRQFQKEVKGSIQAKSDIHYSTSSQEFGEYSLDEIDTFRFRVKSNMGANNITMYSYILQNPTDELTAYLRLQDKYFNIQSIPIDPDTFEKYCMTNNGTPFVLTKEIRKCLESKLWDFNKGDNFYIDITIPFTHTYTICPHVSFYITPLSNMLDEVVIIEITTKQVIFRVRYGSTPSRGSMTTIYSGLKLHFNINGLVKQNDNLLE
jgi:hypothetical protein